MKPSGYTHRESGANLLEGLALLEAWQRHDAEAFDTLLGSNKADARAAVVGVCRAAKYVIDWMDMGCSVDEAHADARRYGLMRRDVLGGDDEVNESNRKG